LKRMNRCCLMTFILIFSFLFPALAEKEASQTDPMMVVDETPEPPGWLSEEDRDRLWMMETPEPRIPKIVDHASYPNTWKDFTFPKSAKVLDIWFPDIRDSDAAILVYEDRVWMLDCGDERAGERLKILLKQLGITRVNKLFNSHPHHDHLNGLTAVDDVAPVEELLICFPEDSTEHMKAAMEAAKERNIRVTHFGDEDVFRMADGRVTLSVWMKSDETRTMNDQSANTMVEYGDCRMLFTADMERAGQRDLLAAVGAEALQADIFKYPHHGKLVPDDDFFAAVNPEVVVITNYRKAGESWYYLAIKHIDMLYTNRDGVFLHLATDGVHWLCEYVPIVPVS